MSKAVFEMTYDGGSTKKSFRDSNIAPIEISSTASTNYSIGDRFVLCSDAKLYVATANILQGTEITPGTNCIESEKLATILKTLLSDVASRVDWNSYAKTGVHQWFDFSNVSSSNINLSGTYNEFTIQGTGTYRTITFLCKVAPNTDYKLLTDIAVTSGTALIVVKNSIDTIEITRSAEYTTNQDDVELSFNTGSNTEILVKVLCTMATSATGNVTYSDMLLKLASDVSDECTPFAMTNQELTNVVPSGTTTSNKLVNASQAFPRDEQAVLGAKNWFKTTATTHSKYDVTFTVNDDGTVELSGISSGNINVGADNGTLGQISNLIVGKEYILSGCPENGSGSTYRLAIRNESNTSEYYVDLGEGIKFTAKNVTYTVYIRADSGINLTGKTFKPMIRLATDPDDMYEPHAMTNQELTELFNVKSLPIVWNPALNLDSNKGASITQYGKMYLISFWFKATTDTTGAIGIIKIPNNNIYVGNYVIAEDNDRALWGGRISIGSDYYVSIGGDLTTGKTYRAQVVGIDLS